MPSGTDQLWYTSWFCTQSIQANIPALWINRWYIESIKHWIWRFIKISRCLRPALNSPDWSRNEYFFFPWFVEGRKRLWLGPSLRITQMRARFFWPRRQYSCFGIFSSIHLLHLILQQKPRIKVGTQVLYFILSICRIRWTSVTLFEEGRSGTVMMTRHVARWQC